MKHWAVLTIGLYVVLLVLVTAPLVVVGTLPEEPTRSEVAHVIAIMLSWPYWLTVIILTLAQALLLVVPVKAAGEIEIRPRHILAPILAGALAMGLLAAFTLWSVIVAIRGDEAGGFAASAVVAVLLAAWVFWFFVFRSFARSGDEPGGVITRITRTLHTGSTLELLVAVACHIVVRRRGDCSAPIVTSYAMAAGIAVMFLSFGPGVFYLFAMRARRMVSKKRREQSGLHG